MPLTDDPAGRVADMPAQEDGAVFAASLVGATRFLADRERRLDARPVPSFEGWLRSPS